MRVFITGDAQRPYINQESNIRWLYRLVAAQIEALGIAPELLLSGIRLTEAEWLDTHVVAEGPCWLSGLVCAPCLVIGFEAPPRTLAFLRRAGIPYVDAVLSPVRFLNDLLFDVEVSGVVADISPFSVLDAKVSANLIAAQAFYKGLPGLPDNTAIIVGQSPMDRSLIVNGRLVEPHNDFNEEVRKVCAAHPYVLFKPHPNAGMATCPEHLLRLGVAGLTNLNIYALLSHSNVSTFYGVSSSVLHECDYFGKKAVFWIEKPKAARQTLYVRDFMSVEFWRDILFKLGAQVKPAPKLTLPFIESRIRRSCMSWWGYDSVEKCL